MFTGEIEVDCKSLNIINESEVPPFEIDDRAGINEELRLQYRYLDLRRPVMQNRLFNRHKARSGLLVNIFHLLKILWKIETPMFVEPTPGGARFSKFLQEFILVRFYALPESPSNV